jgi:hypothetical protein
VQSCTLPAGLPLWGLAVAEGAVSALRTLRVHPSAASTAVELLSDDTAAQIIRLVGDDYLIQIASWIPLGQRASVARHLSDTHYQECCARTCERARDWIAEVAASATLVAATNMQSCTALPA